MSRTDLFSVLGRIAVIDTEAPEIEDVSPTEIIVDALGQIPLNTVLSANITDNLGVRAATIDLSEFSNNFTPLEKKPLTKSEVYILVAVGGLKPPTSDTFLTGFTATLNGAQEVPGTASPATGSGTFTIDTAANTLLFNINYSGLVGGAETAAHIHGPAIAGVNALPIFDLPLGVSKVGVWNYPENLEADILAGRMYVNIHSILFPNGEIRGQILPTSNIQNMILTAGAITDGTWGVIIPSITRMRTFSLPITTNDGSNITNFNFQLSVVNPAPVANPDTANMGVGIGEQADIEVLLNDTDPNGNLPLSLVSVQNVSAGTAVISPDGQHVIVTSPTPEFEGVITAEYTVADSLGATANDDIDGNITARIQTASTVNTATAGTYAVTYTVSDTAGNSATSTRTVNVSAPAPAVIGGGGGFLPAASFQTTATTTAPSPEVQSQINRQLEIERQAKNQGQVLGEKIDFRQIQIKDLENEAEIINAKDLNQLLLNTYGSRQKTIEAEVRTKFTAKLKINLKNLSQADESAITNFIAYGTANTKKLGEGERAGVLDSYKAAYGKLPTTKSDWTDVLKIAVGRFPGTANAEAETRAKLEFKKIYLRDPNLNNQNDKAAINIMAYGLRPDKRNTSAEKTAILSFKAIFKKNPASAADWDKVRAIAYSGAKR